MPYREISVDPELALTHKGISVFRTYTNGNIDDPATYWFDLDPSDDDSREFDVRELKAWQAVIDSLGHKAANNEEELIIMVLMQAIETGELEPKRTATF